jgi:hypothetical protein
MTQPPLDEVKRRIVEALRLRRNLLYAGRSRPDARPDRDLNLIVEVDTTLSPAQLIRKCLGWLLSLILPEALVLYEST